LLVLRSPASFFDTTPIGRILNRFSKDQQAVDEELPQTMARTLIMVYGVISVIVVVSVSSPIFLALLVPLCTFITLTF
jgi:ABC-type multidrug transport system fused ATPase/permease subunit